MKPNKILIIDDEPINISLLEDILKEEHYEIQSAASGEEALSLLPTFDPDLILLDILMSGMDGYEVCQRIRDIEQFRLVKIIMVSAMAMLKERLKGYDVGADDYITKPFKKEELLAKIRVVMRLKETEAVNEKYRAHLEAIFRSVKDGILTVDENKRIMEANDATSEICGIPKNQIINSPFGEVFSCCNKGCETVLEETLHTQNVVQEYRVECKHQNKHRQVVVLSSSPLKDQHNKVIGAVMVIRDTTKIHDLERELIEQNQFHNIIGKSSTMQTIYRLLENLSSTNTTILINGESGTGKELVAKALHYGSERSSKPLIKVNCSALSENLLESELFGHVKGAFTGAIRSRIGRFQAADGGTMFLDEIGDISPLIQLKLLRVLQEREFERVGDTTTQKVDVRVLTATNKDLKEKVRMGEFREDLYYRLKVVEIKLPPLRDRLEDIPLLFSHFCKQFNKIFNKQIEGMSDEVIRIMMEYNWPGNVRELQHAIEHAFVLCNDRTIAVEHLPPELKTIVSLHLYTPKKKFLNATDEAQAFLESLNKTGWNKAKTARMMGVSRPTLYKKMKEYKLEKPSNIHLT
ncbi:MAG: sigma 54-interacting transcriptional regulator [Candidatus Magnetomorum sp.]|nr:sigma 54-interacting transcriptional regulator [Candidatus Magnetomorum sp.]